MMTRAKWMLTFQWGAAFVLIALNSLGMEAYVAYFSILMAVPLGLSIYAVSKMLSQWDGIINSLYDIERVIKSADETLTFKQKVWYNYRTLIDSELQNPSFWYSVFGTAVLYLCFMFAALRLTNWLQYTMIVPVVGFIILGLAIEFRSRIIRVAKMVDIPGAAQSAGLV